MGTMIPKEIKYNLPILTDKIVQVRRLILGFLVHVR